MQNLQASLIKPPYGLAFSIEELLLVRSWAEHRKLRLFVALDQVIDGTEFEEMLILSPPQRVRRTLTLWRTRTGIFAQSPYSRPRAFASLSDALEAVRPQPSRCKGWLSSLGLGIYAHLRDIVSLACSAQHRRHRRPAPDWPY